jgi:hypothetical protein
MDCSSSCCPLAKQEMAPWMDPSDQKPSEVVVVMMMRMMSKEVLEG